MTDDPLGRMQARFNRSTREHWQHFASHRAQIEALLLPEHAPAAGDLCVLGAGNCNDLDLAALCERFDEVHLVDLDRPALEAAVDRQQMSGVPAIHLHAPVDLTGVAGEIGKWREATPDPGDVERVIRLAADAVCAGIAGPFDIVLSPCILSQIMGYAWDVLGRSHAQAQRLRRALRQSHLRLMIDMLRPGGTALIIIDMATAPTPIAFASGRADPTGLTGTMSRITARGDSFADLDPGSVQAAIRSDPRLAPLVSDMQFIRPWPWTLGPAKAFLVYALRLRRSSGTLLLDPSSSR